MTFNEEHLNKRSNDNEGSPKSGEPEFVCVGKNHRTHGIKGLMVFEPMTDFPERIKAGRKVYLGEGHSPAVIRSVHSTGNTLLIGYEGVEDEIQAAVWRNQFVYVKADELPPLPNGRFYYHQLLGLNVVDEKDEKIGVLSEILETGSNNVYVIKKPDGGEELIPALKDIVLSVDLAEKKMVVRLPEWV